MVVKCGYTTLSEVFAVIRFTSSGIQSTSSYLKVINSSGNDIYVVMYQVDTNTVGFACPIGGAYSTIGFEILDIASESDAIGVNNFSVENPFVDLGSTKPTLFGDHTRVATTSDLPTYAGFTFVADITMNFPLSGSVKLYANPQLKECILQGTATTIATNDKTFRAIGSIPSDDYIPKLVTTGIVPVVTNTSSASIISLNPISKNNVNKVIAYAAAADEAGGNNVDIYLRWAY